jgi:hypothetical protein
VVYRVAIYDTHHRLSLSEVETAPEAIALGEKLTSDGIGVAFIYPPNSSERVPLRLFKAGLANDAG